MLWERGRRSENIEDRRGAGPGLPIPVGRGARIGGIGGLGAVVLLLIGLFLGVDPSVILQGGGPGYVEEPRSTGAPSSSPEEDRLKDFVSVVLADTEDAWNTIFAGMGRDYREPTLVLFTGAVRSACGSASAAVGPFYCPADQKVYLDLDFFRELDRRFGAPGDFAQAYVVAHEVGHHVQNLLGIADRVHAARARLDERSGNQLSVRMELQADCLAGVWANRGQRRGTNIRLEPGDVEEGLNAAARIGDDAMQRRSQGYVVPDAFTHGSSAQRVRWFHRGLETGRLDACDTFNTDQL